MILAIYFLQFVTPILAQPSDAARSNAASEQVETRSRVASCPSGLKNLSKEDGDDTFFGLLRNQKESCKKAVAHGNELKSVRDLQLVFKDRFSGITDIAKSNIESCFVRDNEEERYLLSKYYYELDRLQEGNKVLLYQIAAIDKLLPAHEGTMTGISCPHAYFKEANQLCEDLKNKCKDKEPEAFNDLAKKAEEAYKIKMQMDSLKEQRRNLGGEKYTTGDPRYEIDRKIMALSPTYEKAIQDNPWILGDAFKESMKEYHERERYISEREKAGYLTNSIRLAFRSQLKANRNKLNEQIQEFSKVTECFAGDNSDFCNEGKEVRKVLSKTPSTNITYGRQRSYNIGSQYLEAQQCVHDGKLDQDATTDVLNDAAINAGLVVLTSGASLSFGAARFAYAVRNGKSIQAAYRFQRIGTISQTGRSITTAEVYAGIGDVTYAANQVRLIGNKCEQEKVILDELVVKEQAQLCPSYQSDALQAKQNYDKCLFSAYLEGGAGALSGLPIVGSLFGSGGRFLKSYFGLSDAAKTTPSTRSVPSATPPRSPDRPSETAALNNSNVSPARNSDSRARGEGPFTPPENIEINTTDPRLLRIMRTGQDREFQQSIALGNEVAVPLEGGFVNGRIIESDGENVTVAIQDATGAIQRVEVNGRSLRKPFEEQQQISFLDESGAYYQSAISRIEGDEAVVGIPKRPGSTTRGLLEFIRVPLTQLRPIMTSGEAVQFVLDGKVVQGKFKEFKFTHYQIEVDGKIYDVKPNEIVTKPKPGEVKRIVNEKGEEMRVLVQDAEMTDSARVLTEIPGQGFRTIRVPLTSLRPTPMAERGLGAVGRTRVVSEIGDAKFRQSYLTNDFRGDRQYISFVVDDTRIGGKVVDVKPSGEVVVELPGSSRYTIETKDLSSVRQSATAKQGFIESSEKLNVGNVIRYYDEASDQFRYGKVIASKNGVATVSSADVNGRIITRKLSSSETASAVRGDDISELNVANRVQVSRTVTKLTVKIKELEGRLYGAINNKGLSADAVKALEKELNTATRELQDLLVKQGYVVIRKSRGVNIGSHSASVDYLEVQKGPENTLAGYMYSAIRNRLKNKNDSPVKVEIDIYSNIKKGSGGFYQSDDNLINLRPSSILRGSLDELDSVLYHELRHAKIQSLKEAKKPGPYYVEFHANSTDFNLMNPKESADGLYNSYYSIDEVNSYLGEARLGIRYLGSNNRRIIESRYSVSTDAGNIQNDIDKAEIFVNRSREYMNGVHQYVKENNPIEYITVNGVVTARVPLVYGGKKQGVVDLALVDSAGVSDLAGNRQRLQQYVLDVIENNERAARQIRVLRQRLNREVELSEDILRRAEEILN